MTRTDLPKITALQNKARDLLKAARELQLDCWDAADELDTFAELLESTINDNLDVAAKIARREEEQQADTLSPTHDRLAVHQMVG